MHYPRVCARGLALVLALASAQCAYAQTGFYKCESKGQAPVYQDFPCLKGKGGAINGASTREAIEGFIKHGYYGQAKQYADTHGVSQAEFEAMIVSVEKDHEAAERQNQEIAEQRRRAAAQEKALQQMRAAAALAALESDPSLTPQQAPDTAAGAPEIATPATPAAQPWTPGNPTYDPENNRWCQATSPSTTRCW